MHAKDNPFSTDRVLKIRYLFSDSSLDRHIVRLEQAHFFGAIVGPEGSGKTTLCEDLVSELKRRGKEAKLFTLTREERRLPRSFFSLLALDATKRPVIFLDGAEQLNAVMWMRCRLACGRRGGFIITRHTPGRLPTLITCKASMQHLQQIVDKLLCSEKAVTRDLLETLFDKWKGNLRLVLRELYDMYANRDEDKNATYALTARCG